MKKTIIINILLSIIFLFALASFIIYVRVIANSWELYHYALELEQSGSSIPQKEIQGYLNTAIIETFVLIFNILTMIASIVIFIFTNPQIFQKHKKDE